MKHLKPIALTINLALATSILAACASQNSLPATSVPASPTTMPVAPTATLASTAVPSTATLIPPTATTPAPTATPPSPTATPTVSTLIKGVVPLVEGLVAFVRVEKETTAPEKDETPPGEDMELSFGDQVTLEKRDKDSPMWLVSKDGKRGWVSAARLTANKAEIEFLRRQKRIPTSTSLIFAGKDGVVRVNGLMIMSLSMNSAGRGTGGAPGSSASSQFASEGNAVFVDESVVKMSPPIMTMACGTKTYKLRTDAMYYCTGVDDKGEGCFECLDLATLSKCAE